jgi:hypothetical protein
MMFPRPQTTPRNEAKRTGKAGSTGILGTRVFAQRNACVILAAINGD